MSLYIASNPTAFSIWAYLTQNATAMANTKAHLATGLRIMTAADDPVGLGISERLQAQIGGLNQAQSTTQLLSNMLSTAGGALKQTYTTLASMYTLAQEAQSPLYSNQISTLQTELYAYSNQIDFTGKSTVFNGHQLLDGGANASNDSGFSAMLFTAMVGAIPGEIMTFSISTMTASALGILSTQLSVDTTANASQTMANIQNAMNLVSSQQGYLGGMGNVLSAQLAVLQVQSSNLSAANSSITNLDVAAASSQLANEQLTAQSATAMLVQANQEPASLLTLLGLPAPSVSIA